MLVIKPVTIEDVDALLDLANLSTYGLTTLPKDRDLLERRTRHAARCFKTVADDAHPNASGAEGQSYLFALHDTDAQKLVGISGLESKLGGFHPFYYYKVETSVHESKALDTRKEIPTLQLVAEHDGPSELCSLFLHPAYRQGGTGRVLSVSRFLYMAQYPTLFDPTVIAEMRGVIDDSGRSPFWDAVGTHFFGMDFPMADYLSIKVKELTGELLPRHPIYVPLLPKTAQAVVGKVHPKTEPALAILRREGFDYNGWVNIFEGGPVITSQRDSIRGVRESKETIIASVVDREIESEQYVVSVSDHDRVFAACEARLRIEDGCVTLTHEVAKALQVGVGDTVRYVKLRPDKPGETQGAKP
ncbi:arginine N-succinyltransferase [Phycisphaeraceae bacterium D3-23]